MKEALKKRKEEIINNLKIKKNRKIKVYFIPKEWENHFDGYSKKLIDSFNRDISYKNKDNIIIF